jgi:Protein of unknown function (DUF3237)
MTSRPLMRLQLQTSATEVIGPTARGTLSIYPVIGGSFAGDRLRGRVLAGGGDWVTALTDGTFEVDLRITLETNDGALIHMTFSGVRDDAHQYFRTVPRFETAAPNYEFLNRLLAIGTGEIGADGPLMPSRRFSDREGARSAPQRVRQGFDVAFGSDERLHDVGIEMCAALGANDADRLLVL